MATSSRNIGEKRDASHFELENQQLGNKKLKFSSDIYQEIASKNPQISLEALERIFQYIQDNSDLFTHATLLGKSIYIRREPDGLERTIQFSPDNRVYVHLNRITYGDPSMGSGAEKIACFALELFSVEWHASASLNLPLGEDERRALEFFKGTPGFVQMVDEAFYDFSETQLERFESPPTTQKQRVLFKFCDGGNLEKWVSNYAPGLSPGLLLQNKKSIFNSLIRNVPIMHKNNWIHRDLNMKNIFLQKNSSGIYEAVIGDFGSACKTDQQDKKKNVTTTAYITAPELALRARDLERYYFVKASQEDEEYEDYESPETNVAAGNDLTPSQEFQGSLSDIEESQEEEDHENVSPSPSSELGFESDEEPIPFDPNIDATIERIKDEIGNATTPAVDMWAIGCILYKFLEGRKLPWELEPILAKVYTSIDTFSTPEEISRWFPEPENKTSPLHLVWEMIKADPAMRINAEAAAARLETLNWS